ncbi:rRNA-processing protein FCF1 homolog isoform X3 [Muntiacus reevesi]|uniref:rRNA-processing protein FCF1 homolog isoform X3 n=1 Tax=Muntiacus reevesi TaxID=9886 RepID=UPI003306BA2B
MDCLGLVAVQGTLESLLQHHNSKASILWHSAFFIESNSHIHSKEKDRLKPKKKEKKDPSALKEREVPQHPSCLFFQYNTQLGPPYHILVDTNFINFSIKAKLDLVQSMMDCLYAKCIPCITDCVMAEIEKLGQKYRVALSKTGRRRQTEQRMNIVSTRSICVLEL